MKILYVNDYKNQIGGAEKYMYSLKDALEKKGHIVKIFSAKDTIESTKKHISLIKRIFNISYLSKFNKEVLSFKPDIIHLHGIFNEISPSILLATHDIPVIMTVHNNQLVNAVTNLSARTGGKCNTIICPGCTNCVGITGMIYESIKRIIHRKLLKKVRLYITPSKYMQDLIEKADYSPVKRIPNGFMIMKRSPIINWNRLLYVGRLTKEKGVDYLILSMTEVLRSNPTTILDIVGNGNERDALKKLVKGLHLEDTIRFHMDISHNNVQKFYEDTTLVIVPSVYNDNFPTVCIEALSVGRPIVGTNVGGIPELVANDITGITIPAKDTHALANAINTVLSDKGKIQEYHINSLSKSKEYSLDNHIPKILNIYEKYKR